MAVMAAPGPGAESSVPGRCGYCATGGRWPDPQLVAGGHAVAYGAYEQEERAARNAGRGIWSSRFERPADWRAKHRNQ